MNKPSDFVSDVRKVSEHLGKARDILSRGLLDYYFEKLVEHSDALLHQYAPLKVGQNVVISGTVECTHGWKGRERTLASGATGTISDVDFAEGQFWFYFVPDNEWWTDLDGNEHKSIRSHSYKLSAHVLEARDDVAASRASDCSAAFDVFCQNVRKWDEPTEWAKKYEQRYDLLFVITDLPLSAYAIFQAGWELARRGE